MREGLAALINSRSDMEIVGDAADGREALELAVITAPDLVLMDVSMPVLDGIQATRRLKEELPGLKVLALTAYDSRVYLRQLLAAGASGYVLKRTAAKFLVDAIEVVAKGDTYFDPDMSPTADDDAGGNNTLRGEIRGRTLTGREQDVLTLVAKGHTNKEISSHLGISVKTVEVHKNNFMSKLGLKNRADAVRYALRLGWLDCHR
jgi:DNA-binding NarL/FixJ family response regulator